MFRAEASAQYAQALKAGQKTYRECVLAGKYPYLQVLDEILSSSMTAGRVDLGVIEVPMDRIVGTKEEGRHRAFAPDFMPLLPADSEFATKWIDLCSAHLSDEGIRDPIRCFEYMGRFYVQEGNKRVSVLKSFGARSVSGFVTRVIPAYSDDEAVQIYYEFMEFYRLSGTYSVYFSKPGGFKKLQAALGFEPERVWTEEERRRFKSRFAVFSDAFAELGGERLPVTAGDALLVWLELYPAGELRELSTQEIGKSLAAVWSDVKARALAEPIAVSVDAADEPQGKRLLKRLGSVFLPSRLKIAFVNLPDAMHSTWTAAHEQGRRTLEQALGSQVEVTVHDLGHSGDMDAAMEAAEREGAQVVFATAPPLIAACRRLAARRPDIKVLNCSVAMPYPGVRTYYSRVYEGKFITGAIAGAMTRGDTIGYIAGSPIFGVPASINAFALGARLTNPSARVSLVWSCVSEDPIAELKRRGVDIISNRDIPMPQLPQGEWGLCSVQGDGTLKPLASPYWDWGIFYIRIVSSILNGSWDALEYKSGGKAVNYWWGMASGTVGLKLADDLPDGVRSLANILCRSIIDGAMTVFHRKYRSQDGSVVSDGNHWLDPEDVLHMDWLADNVDGSIPGYDELLPMARSIVRFEGLYRDTLPPEKGGSPL